MLRVMMLLALVACRDRSATPEAVCEYAYERALANQERYLAEVLAETPQPMQAGVRAQAARELASLERTFVSTCKTDADFKPECFDSPESGRTAACRAFLREFLREATRH